MNDNFEDDDAEPTAEKIAESQAAQAKYRKSLRGQPHRYEWISPIGKFEIDRVGRRRDGAGIWELLFEGRSLRQYADPFDAMLAVCNQATDDRRWDEFCGAFTKPVDSKDWSSTTA